MQHANQNHQNNEIIKRVQLVVLIIPYICFAFLVLFLICVNDGTIWNIGLYGSITGLPIGIIGQKKTTYKKLAIGDIIIGTVTLLALVGLMCVLIIVGRIIGGLSAIG